MASSTLPSAFASSADVFVEHGPAAGRQAISATDAYFPGMTFAARGSTDPLFRGSGLLLGAGAIFSVTACGDSKYEQPRHATTRLGMIIPVTGSVEITEDGRRYVVGSDSLCIFGGQRAVGISSDLGTFLIVQVPREMVLRRYPHYGRRTIHAFDPDDPGGRLLRNSVLGVAPQVAQLDQIQRSVLLQAIVDMFGLPRMARDKAEWRVQKALSDIDANLGDTNLVAEAVARRQFISRRSLDELFVRILGRPIAAEITNRRLMQAAQDLTDPAQAGRSIGDLAYSLGFEHAAHFTRAFARRFGAAPTLWRRRASENATPVFSDSGRPAANRIRPGRA